MKWIEIWIWDSSSQSFFPAWEIVPKTEEELKQDALADKICTWFWSALGAILGVAAIVAIVAIATL